MSKDRSAYFKQYYIKNIKPHNLRLSPDWIKNHTPEKLKIQKSQYMKDRYKRIKEFIKERARKWRLDNPTKVKNQRLIFKYNISLDEVKKMYDMQKGACLICHLPKKLVVDHDHSTKRVRGLLCHSCNITLGHIEKAKNNNLLEEVINYLKTPNKRELL